MIRDYPIFAMLYLCLVIAIIAYLVALPFVTGVRVWVRK